MGDKNLNHDVSTHESDDDIIYSNKFIADEAEVDVKVSQTKSNEINDDLDDEPGIDLQLSESFSDDDADEVGSLEDFIDDDDADDDFDSTSEDSDDDF